MPLKLLRLLWILRSRLATDTLTARICVNFNNKDGNDALVGTALKESGLDRSSLYLASKLGNIFYRPEHLMKAVEKTLNDLQVGYLDLLMLHWPFAHLNDGKGHLVFDSNKVPAIDNDVTVHDAWRAIESLVDQGIVRDIGVSNFAIRHLEHLEQATTIKPAVNQVEMHPYLAQTDLLNYCKEKGIVITAYSPLGARPNAKSVLNDPVVDKVAVRNSKSKAQVLLSWANQRGTITIPKSAKPARIQENFGIFELSSEDMDDLNKLDKGLRYIDPSKAWNMSCF